MRRIRTIKPEILEDEVTSRLSHEAYRLFIGMILLADDYGGMRASPSFLTGQIFWGRPTTERTEDLLSELEASGLVSTHTISGQSYAYITGWAKHQRVDRPGKPLVPEKPERSSVDVQNSRDSREGSRLTGTGIRTGTGIGIRIRTGILIADPPVGGVVIPMAVVDRDPGDRTVLDLEAVYAEFPRHEGKSRGLTIARRQIHTQAEVEELRRAVRTYARIVRGREVRHVKHFSTFMGCWRDYLDEDLVAQAMSASEHGGMSVDDLLRNAAFLDENKKGAPR